MTAAAARRFLPSDPKDFLRSAVPLALLALAAWEPGARLVVLALLVLGTVIATQRHAPVRWTWAGAVPAAAAFAVHELDPYFAGSFPAFCATPGNEQVSEALLSGVVVTGTIVALAVALGADRTSLFGRLPRPAHVAWIPIGLGSGLVFGSLIAPVVLLGTLPTALLPVAISVDAIIQAVAYGVGTAVAMELAYRAALIGWSARILGVGPSVAGQAVIVAVATGLLGGVEPVPALVLAGYALLMGVVTVQSRSIAISLATTVGFASTFYLQAWC